MEFARSADGRCTYSIKGATKMRDMNLRHQFARVEMQDMKMQDQLAGVENEGKLVWKANLRKSVSKQLYLCAELFLH